MDYFLVTDDIHLCFPQYYLFFFKHISRFPRSDDMHGVRLNTVM